MPSPKCSRCSKIIPDGFTDCPWCGAKQALPFAGPAQQASSPQTPTFTPSDRLAGLALLLSLIVFFGCSYLTITRDKAANPFASPAYFHGEWVGTYFWGAALVTIFSVIRGRRIRSSVKFCVIFGAGVLLSLMALTRPVRRLAADPAQMGEYFGKVTKNSGTAQLDKWSVAVRPFFMDLISHNRQYVGEVSKLDEALQPLYSPASFRDPATAQAMLDALAQRLAIADKYADIQPILAKMPGYVAAVDATDKEKQEFMDGFNESIAKALNGKNSVPALEHNWIVSTLGLYKFALTHTYSYNVGNILFKSSADAVTFNNKLNKSRELYAQFVRAYQASRRAQDAALGQMGLQRSDIGLNNPKQ